ncbi:MAG: hypothetical protein ACSHYF_14260 [Verrucomicrobiaceae bacterium]
MDFSNIGTDGLILGALLIFAVLGFIKKLVGFFFFVISVAIGAVAGIWGHNNGFSLSKVLVEKPEPWMSVAVGAIAFFGAFFFAKTILGFLQGGSRETGAFSKLGFGIPGSVLSLVVGGVILYGALTGVRYAGTMAELERLKEYAGDNFDAAKAEPFFAKIKTWIDASRIGQLHQKFDFLNDPAQANAAKLAIVQDKPGAFYQMPIDEIPHALPVEESLQSSIREGDFGALLKNDRLRDVTKDAKAREALMKLNVEKSLGLRQ